MQMESSIFTLTVKGVNHLKRITSEKLLEKNSIIVLLVLPI